MKVDVMFGRFPFGAVDHPDVTDWMIETVIKAKSDPRIGRVLHSRQDDTPITMTRNKMVDLALQNGVDYLLMVDSDMSPDIPVPGAKPFWDTTLEFMLQHNGPCVVGAPYCGPPPMSNVYVFRWATWQNNNPQPDQRLEQYSREEAAQRIGIEQVAALPTGLIIYDMRCFKMIEPPYFYYEWTDHKQLGKASTEDVANTRDLALRGIPQYCNWDAWAGHWKRIRVDKPVLITTDTISEKYKAAVLRGAKLTEKLVMFGEGINPASKDSVDMEAFNAARRKRINGHSVVLAPPPDDPLSNGNWTSQDADQLAYYKQVKASELSSNPESLQRDIDKLEEKLRRHDLEGILDDKI